MYRIPLVCLLALLGASAGAQNGLNINVEAPAELRAVERSMRFGLGDFRLDLAVSQFGTAQAGGRLLGDYYLTGPGFGGTDVSGGLRLTSGLAVGPREGIAALPVSRTGGGVQLGPRDPGSMLAYSYGEQVTLPYFGVGYTTLSSRAGWGLSADIGLGGQRPGERVRFGGNPTAAQFEGVLNDLRLAPVIQLGVSYAF
jgi:hypothetical protein